MVANSQAFVRVLKEPPLRHAGILSSVAALSNTGFNEEASDEGAVVGVTTAVVGIEDDEEVAGEEVLGLVGRGGTILTSLSFSEALLNFGESPIFGGTIRFQAIKSQISINSASFSCQSTTLSSVTASYKVVLDMSYNKNNK